jgi:hypothetical protein
LLFGAETGRRTAFSALEEFFIVSVAAFFAFYEGHALNTSNQTNSKIHPPLRGIPATIRRKLWVRRKAGTRQFSRNVSAV